MSLNETPTAVQQHVYHQDGSSGTVGDTKAEFILGDSEVERQEASGRVPEQPPRRYWLRGLVLIFVPSIVTAYYGVIWVHLLHKNPMDEAVKYRTYSGSLIYYSWFIIGVFCLSWSKFGLVGAEASMLCSHFWGAQNLVALLMHSNGTWSSPSGWINALVRREFHRLWCLLAFLSLLPFIALPLSGLVFEITDGYVKTPDAPIVIGRNSTTFNLRYDEISRHGEKDVTNPALSAWLVGSSPAIPGLGVIFSGESVDRSNHSVFSKLPNTLPLNDSISDLFLAPQANRPVSGTAWGLRFKYECSTVRSVSEFTILNQRPASSVIDFPNSSMDDFSPVLELRTPSGDMITVACKSLINRNVQAYVETGKTAPLESSFEKDPLDAIDKYKGNHPGFDAELVFEYAAWQLRMNGLYDDYLLPFNTSVGNAIEGMGSPFQPTDDGRFAVNRTFFTTAGDLSGLSNENVTIRDVSDLLRLPGHWVNGSSDGRMLYVAPPIGVRCVAASDVGTAELDGVTSTFRNFQRVSPDFDKYFQGSLRFGRTAEAILQDQFHQHYISGGLPQVTVGETEDSRRHEVFIDSESLLRSVNLAYALDASNLMYGLSSTYRDEWVEQGLTSSRAGRVLSVASLIPGSGVGYFVLALFCVWAALSATLGLVYGFRKRPADKLDGYSMLRIGADMAPELIENRDFMSGMPYQDSGTMAAMPCNASRQNSVRQV
ncbi:hypothetical protein N657DRAFT_630609 [Parathielavia appendiculata]|uniref:Uncharacterized protein n=1 Tax=Parathielavia appendiculata TaxID=2587402 RepID=A0AAN6ZA10_9PEZI|nr:hypothetical protein N657DRAFT_630609 [Parathielavia appendiculata]